MHQEMDLQLFADAGTLVNAGGNYVNAYTGETTAFPEGGGMTASMKTFYDTELLENARPELIHTQFARKQVLPAGARQDRGVAQVEYARGCGRADRGRDPDGAEVRPERGDAGRHAVRHVVSVSDQLELHAIDDVILGAAEELGASAGTTQDKLVRNVVVAGTNVQYCDKVGTNGAHTAVTSRAGLLDTTAKLTPDEVNKAVTLLKSSRRRRSTASMSPSSIRRSPMTCARRTRGSRRTSTRDHGAVYRRDRRAARRALHRDDGGQGLQRRWLPGQDRGGRVQWHARGVLQRVRDAVSARTPTA